MQPPGQQPTVPSYHSSSVTPGDDTAFQRSRLHPLLSSRWSPTTFDPAYKLPRADIELLLEAARWAPSAGNSQPWAFIVGCRGDDVHQRLVRHLAGSSARWAPSASLLLANLSHRFVEETDWEYSEFAQYDLGQAIAHLTFQARALELFVRQFRAFDREAVAAEFDVPEHWEVTTMAAVGRLPEGVGQVSQRPARDRRPLDELVHAPEASASPEVSLASSRSTA
jgi:nitroreductase